MARTLPFLELSVLLYLPGVKACGAIIRIDFKVLKRFDILVKKVITLMRYASKRAKSNTNFIFLENVGINALIEFST